MCLILLSYEVHPVFKLVLAANRDEFYDRPTASLQAWEDEPQIIAGRDLKGGGTWLGVSPNGRLAAITNYRDPGNLKPDAPTRGTLVTTFLSGEMSAYGYLEELSVSAGVYNGFNLIVYDGRNLCFFSNQEGLVRSIPPGVHGLSNHLLDTPWPKVERGLALFRTATAKAAISRKDIFEILRDRNFPPDSQLPKTGVGIKWERILSPLFIASDIYGTRSSAIVSIDADGEVIFAERTYNGGNDRNPNSRTRRVAFRIKTSAG